MGLPPGLACIQTRLFLESAAVISSLQRQTRVKAEHSRPVISDIVWIVCLDRFLA